MLITPPPPPPPPKKKLWLPIVTDSAGSPSTSSRYPCNQHHLYLEKELPYIDKNVKTGEVSRKRKASVTRTHTNQKKLSIVHYKSRCTQSFSETIIETSDGIAYHNIKQLTNVLYGFCIL
ncbi:uncharacterized protein OCT59_006499 [Rhizophagus irregularis]|uniref:uncharacterized protein n=1 Tax=Rhizophagus irregularis TaxID=588596 RepID=UPI000CC7D458|nr:hypothetical protein OCT59_006499 [Rhizophagus irregularis]GBC20190.1 hypothetical protein RIR_jg37403.t1 [Rhizophagus irregularis DAOM 181602=DAOM 197198]CAB5191468.1 unnamed protein product [Rhizophagus irregularis]